MIINCFHKARSYKPNTLKFKVVIYNNKLLSEVTDGNVLRIFSISVIFSEYCSPYFCKLYSMW